MHKQHPLREERQADSSDDVIYLEERGPAGGG